MSAKNNARTAWKEVTKMVGLDREEDTAVETASEVVEPQVEVAAAPAPVATPAPVAAPKTGTTVIAEGTTVCGNITTDGDMTVNGKVHGDIKCGGTLQCCGIVEGSISAKSIQLVAAKVKGDLNATDTAQIDLDTVVIGNATAQNITLDGKLKGDLTVSGMTQLTAHAVLLGNITTDRLSISEGSRFSGALMMTEGKDLAAVFPNE